MNWLVGDAVVKFGDSVQFSFVIEFDVTKYFTTFPSLSLKMFEARLIAGNLLKKVVESMKDLIRLVCKHDTIFIFNGG